MTTENKPADKQELKPCKYFLDTEFIESGRHRGIQLISIGIVAEDGREYYAESREFNPDVASAWVKENVLIHLRPLSERKPVDVIVTEVLHFIGGTKPEFWGYYADYDWVVFCQMFGSMIDLPKGWPMYCRDIKQFCDDLGNPKLPDQTSTEHNALSDARWNVEAWKFLASLPSNVTEHEKERCRHGNDNRTCPACAEIGMLKATNASLLEALEQHGIASPTVNSPQTNLSGSTEGRAEGSHTSMPPESVVCAPNSENQASPAQTPSPVAPESETEEWTVPESDTENDGLYNIDTGRCILLRMVTDDYQMACDICDAHNAAIAQVQQRVKELLKAF